MILDTNKLFADICKRGCIIETSSRYKYATKHLPKCLILVNENSHRQREFVIRSIIPNNKWVTFRINNAGVLIYVANEQYIFNFDIDYARNLDFITSYLHYYDGNILFIPGNYFPCINQVIERVNTLALENKINYKQILKNKLIENLTELYLIKFMYLTSKMLSLPEIKIVIVEILFKLDKWNNLEI